ncbi:DNA helicase II [Aquicella lusitana]|uniref:DNA 3'-5' helicase n=2 Tax=Aquicella lusitana TaxID=254246 RepID=A0A370GA69_9COXI|nr:DNA helicase II [Aquicella lusitana]RDI40076.1 ATP-dependent DNA helicase UvrD [Aquicella lusitana]VVC72356.1 DNA helicase II [Aquicella lusitana]
MILNSLNPAQQEAVRAPLGHQLVLAGAGSGKTRVLTHRLVWLVEVEKVSPFNILAVTFTNKAAHEMRSRIESLLQIPAKTLWIGTFHGLSHRLLRAHWQEAGLPQSFQILDSDDQYRMVRRVILTLNLDEDRFPPKEAQWFINAQKEEAREPHQVEPRDMNGQTMIKIYQAYQEACQRAGVIDFADLLLKTYKLLQSNDTLRAHYQDRFRCLLVDEFQDTNAIQYAWLKLLAGEENAVMIVGDDDQSIYGWRGARIENIQRFSKDFPGAKIIRLEQNYRSTGTILKAANALISQNSGRLGKNLWTEGKDGDLITVYAGFNETDEAFFIVNRIRELRQSEHSLREMAILYRSNAQSRVIEEALMQFGIPYRVYGGLRYFDRAEIKDALAYLRIIANRSDDPAFERIINTPTRGIGDRTLTVIRDHAKATGLTLWAALEQLLQQKFFTARTENALLAFVNLITSMTEKTLPLELHKQVEYVLFASGLMDHYRKEKGEKGLTRLENLEELVNAAHQFTQEGVPDDMPPIAAFLAYAALESSEEQAEAYEDCVQLMTLHSAKGLEFPVVFLAGCEEELFPHYLSMHDPKAIEEERRLCYVGVTRAMKKLYMTYAELRRMHGKEAYHRPSRFLHEIPAELIHEIRFRAKVSRPQPIASTFKPEAQGKFRIGQEVHHRIFGDGTVIDLEGDGDDMKVKVRFAKVGTKMLIASYLSAK